MEVKHTSILDILIFQPTIFSDKRGVFFEFYNSQTYQNYGLDSDFVQENISKSLGGTLRGLHYQVNKPQGKLLQVLYGKIYDVAVDLRQNSTNFGKWVGNYFSEDDYQQIWIPPGFAHGYYVLSDVAIVFYKATNYYSPKDERVIIWNDSTLDIHWPIDKGKPFFISEKDNYGLPFTDSAKL